MFSVYNTDFPRFDQISGTIFVFILILTKGQNNLCSCLKIHDFISDLWTEPSGSLEVYWGPHVAEIGMILRFWEDILCVPRAYQLKKTTSFLDWTCHLLWIALLKKTHSITCLFLLKSMSLSFKFSQALQKSVQRENALIDDSFFCSWMYL